MLNAPVYAVFSEYSPESKPMQPGMNTRVFNHVDAQSPDGSIQLDQKTGVITLPPGTYHLNGFSSTVYFTGEEPPEMTLVRTPYANGGYCRLRYADELPEDHAAGFAFGSISSANAVPSLVETYLTTAEGTKIVMDHPSGSDTTDVYLQVHSNESAAHVFARLAIRRL